MSNNDEILFKVALDLSKADNQFKDHSELWKKHNEDISKGEKAMQDYADRTVKDYDKINKTVKNLVGSVSEQGKAIQDLDKKFQTLSKNNKETFDSKELKDFDALIQKLSKDMGVLEKLNLSSDDIDKLIDRFSKVEDDFGSLNVLVDFFEDKMKQASVGVIGSLDDIQEKIKETQLGIKTTEDFIKEIDKKIEATAPGKNQANLIAERDAAKKILIEDKIALEDYKNQLRELKTTNVSLGTELRKVKDEMVKLELEGQRGSERWIELKEKANEYNSVLKNTNAELNRASSSTAGIDNLIGAVNGLVGVFAAAEGAQALFGNESEDVHKTLVKLNGAVALLNGLQAVQTEVTKKSTIANKALTFVQGQYSVATDASAKSTARLAAATKLLGIGLIVGAVAALVVYWKDIAKWIGKSSDETERMNSVTKTAKENYSEQIAKLTLLNKTVKEGGLSFNEKKKAVDDYNKTFGETLGTVKSYTELEKKLIENGPAYIKYLGLKAKAEAAYQLALEKSKESLIKRNSEETKFGDYLKAFTTQSYEGETSVNVIAKTRNNEEARNLEKEADELLNIQKELNEEMERLAKELGLIFDTPNKELEKEFNKMSDLLQNLIKKQKSLRNDLIQNDRDREVSQITEQLEEEKKAYAKQIDELKISEEGKRKLRQKFNEIYNAETGSAYEKLRSDILKIDEKYNLKLEKVQFDALKAIDSILNSSAQTERESIKEKWDNIRDEIQEQIEQTNDQFKKAGLEAILMEVNIAENKEIQQFDMKNNLDLVNRQQDIADAVLQIYQANARDIIKNERIKQLQLLTLEKQYFENMLAAYEKGFTSLEDKQLFDELTKIIQTSVDPKEIEEAGKKLAQSFGDEVATGILKTVGALKEVKNAIDDISTTKFEDLIEDFGLWTQTLESFSLKLAETLGLQGKQARQFAEGLSTAVRSTLESLNTIYDLEIDEHNRKLDAIQDTIDDIEDELDREKELYEDGYANNYESRQKDLETLKDQKKQEEEELQKAQKKKAALQKVEFLADTLSQLSNMITASTNIFNWASKIPFIGVPLAIGLIGTMFGAFAIAKTKAFQAIGQGANFRKGLEEGPLSLKGPRHEEQGFGLYNSKTGERVAEFEDGEDVFVVNSNQKRKYQHVLDALIADAQGRASLDSTLEGYYKPKVGEQALQVVRNINMITVKAENAKEVATSKNDEMVQQLIKLNENFEKEFEGFKSERDNDTQSWETTDYYYVKKGNLTKKYPKIK